jgi:hypothetical protein
MEATTKEGAPGGPVLTDPLRCGGCKGDAFKLAHVQAEGASAQQYVAARVTVGRHGFAGYIAVTCIGCGAVSELHPVPAALRVEWAADNDRGVLCGGWR